MRSPLPSMVPVWLAAVVGAVLVGALTGDRYLTWLPVVMALCTLVAFAIQLALRRTEGLVTRLAGSMVGAFGVLVVATVVLIAVEPAGLHLLS